MNTRKRSFYLQQSQLLLALLLFILLVPSCESGNFFKGKKKTVVVLLHGLGGQKEGMSFLDPLRKKVADDLSGHKDVTVIAPARTQSLQDSLDEQVKALHTLLQQSHKDGNLIIYGHSQGAVLAAYLWCKHGSDLSIKTLILDRGPLTGFDPFSPANKDTFNKLVKLPSLLIAMFSPFMPEEIRERFNKCIENLDSDGVQDLSPDSDVIKEIGSKLPNLDIPVMLITAKGVQDLSPDSDVIKEIGSKLPNVDIPVILITANYNKFIEERHKEILKQVSGADIGVIWDKCTPAMQADFENNSGNLLSFFQNLNLQHLFGDPNDGLISLKSQNFNGTTHANIERIDAGNYSHAVPIQDMKQEVYDKLLERIKSHINTE